MSETVTKRLHISGVTPAISPDLLSKRLGTFGTVTAVDEFGKLDALGQPRKFGYVTLETTQAQLARCMNLLSGVTWKGAKLRIGEAKPDFRERIAAEHEAVKRAAAADDDGPPKKRRRLPRGVQGVSSSDMSLVTPENVSERAGWRVTPLGRLIRPVRMRPAHPLPEPLTAAPPKTKGKGIVKERKRKPRDPPTRARRRTIDPMKWGSTHLKGAFLESVVVDPIPLANRRLVAPEVLESEESESSEEEQESDDAVPEILEKPTTSLPRPVVQVSQKTAIATPAPASRTTATAPALKNDLTAEKDKTLGLLQSLFGNKTDWGGQESIGSDVDMDELPREDGNDFQEDVSPKATEEDVMDVEQPTTEQTKSQEIAVESLEEHREEETTRPSSHQVKLKDLFAPREEEAGFSLLGHLDLDLDLDDELDIFALTESRAPTVPSAAPSHLHSVVSSSQVRVTLDSTQPLFFPLTANESDRGKGKGRARDTLDVMREKGWDWRSGFFRTESEEQIRARWEEGKVELTREWKRRHREAVKSKRRRGGGDGE